MREIIITISGVIMLCIILIVSYPIGFALAMLAKFLRVENWS